MALLGQAAQAGNREPEPQADDEQSGRRQADRDGIDGVHAPVHEDREPRSRPDARQQEARRGLMGEHVGTLAAHPYRRRHEQERGRPRDAVDDPAEVRRRLEHIQRVAERVDRAAERDQPPGAPARAGHQHAAADRHRQQEGVADRVGELGRDGRGPAAGSVHDALEGERRAERGRAQTGDGAVEPRGGHEPARLAPQQERERQVGGGVERDVEDVGGRRGRRRGAVQRLDGERDVAGGPHQHREGERERHRPPGPAAERPREGERAHDDLERRPPPSRRARSSRHRPAARSG